MSAKRTAHSVILVPLVRSVDDRMCAASCSIPLVRASQLPILKLYNDGNLL